MTPFVYENEKAVVRIYPGKLTLEESRAKLEGPARQFYSSIKKSETRKGKKDDRT